MSSEPQNSPQKPVQEKYSALVIEHGIARVLKDSEGIILASSDPIALKGYMDLYCRVKNSVNSYMVFSLFPYTGKTRDLTFIIRKE
jgi:hypothetical protein